jgi:hypothetical protein
VTSPWIPRLDSEGRTVTPSPRPHLQEPNTRVDSALPQSYEVDAGMWLARLRAEFPRWGVLFDPWRSSWVAVRGRHQIEVAPTAIALRDALDARRS